MNWKASVVRVFTVGVLLVVGNQALAGEATAQNVERSKVCMMQDQVQTKPGIPRMYEGKTYYLCCPMCVAAFDGAPQRYSQARDPVDGQVVDKATAPILGYRGRAYFFASEESQAAFAMAPDRYLAARP